VSGPPVQQIDATDWTSYYDRPFFLSRVTRPLGVRRLIKRLKDQGVPSGGSFLELGGGNSCIFEAIGRAFQPKRYVAADANELGLRLLQERGGSCVEVACVDLLGGPAPQGPYDVVFSIGLIEHFDVAGTRTIVRRHFESVRPGGLVLMTFPTPTATYRMSRWVSERLGLWKFPDERPLEISEVLGNCGGAEVLYSGVGRWTPFTQAVVVARTGAIFSGS
jgi:hypothetical protein